MELSEYVYKLAKVVASFPSISESWFDLVARLWLEIGGLVRSETLLFTQFFGHSDESVNVNPNLTDLLQLQYDASHIVLETLDFQKSFADACVDLGALIERTHLTTFGDDQYNCSTLPWSIIKAIDIAVRQSSLFHTSRLRGPVNKLELDEVGVYLAPLVTPLTTYKEISQLERVEELSTYNRQLNALRFHCPSPYNRGSGLPTVKLVRDKAHHAGISKAKVNESVLAIPDHANSSANDVQSLREIRIGISPLASADVLAGGTGFPLKITRPMGSAFVAEYPQECGAMLEDMLCRALEYAIESACDILVFPELVVSPHALRAIQCKLRESSIRGRLKLIVMGSTWEMSPDGASGNNVCHLLDGAGCEVGTYHKRSPFEDGDVYTGLVEGLADSGKTTTIADVEGIGRVVVGICKDVASNRQHTVELVRDFDADIVAVPAMSKSVNRGFDIQFEYIAKQYLAICVLCNYCGARRGVGFDDNTTEICRIVVPAESTGSNPKQAGSADDRLLREPECLARCLSSLEGDAPTSCLKIARIVPDSSGIGLTPFMEKCCSDT